MNAYAAQRFAQIPNLELTIIDDRKHFIIQLGARMKAYVQIWQRRTYLIGNSPLGVRKEHFYHLIQP